MPTVEIPVRIDYPGSGGPGYNVWTFVTTGAALASNAQVQAAITALQTFYQAISAVPHSIYPNSASITFEGLVYDYNTPRGEASYPVWTIAAGGSTADFSAVDQIACYLGTGTRRLHGRKFLGPVASSAADTDGTPLDALVSAVQSALNALVTGGSSSTHQLAVHSRKHATDAVVTNAQVEDMFAVLRSRRARTGR